MTREEILTELTKIVSSKIKVESIDESSNLSELGFDSLDKAEIIITIEDTFNVEFSEDEMMSIQTVGDLVNFIVKKLN